MKKTQSKTLRRIMAGSSIILATALGIVICVSLLQKAEKNGKEEGNPLRAVSTAENERPVTSFASFTPDERWQNRWKNGQMDRLVPNNLGKRKVSNWVYRTLIIIDGTSYTMKESIPILEEQLQSKVPKVRLVALHHLGSWSYRLQGHEVLGKLLDLFDHEKDRLVKRAILSTLVIIKDRRALPLYKRIAKKRDSDLRCFALVAWVNHEPDIAVPKLLDFMIETQNRRDYFNAYDHLCRITAEAFDKKRELFKFEQPRSVKAKHADKWKKRLRGYWTNLDVTLEGGN